MSSFEASWSGFQTCKPAARWGLSLSCVALGTLLHLAEPGSSSRGPKPGLTHSASTWLESTDTEGPCCVLGTVLLPVELTFLTRLLWRAAEVLVLATRHCMGGVPSVLPLHSPGTACPFPQGEALLEPVSFLSLLFLSHRHFTTSFQSLVCHGGRRFYL